MNISEQIINALLQVALFSLVPLIWWTVTASKKIGFFKWIGIKKPVIDDKKKTICVFAITAVIFTLISFIVDWVLSDSSQLASAQFSNQGIKMLAPALIYAFLKTGLSEEILFRGFFAKRLISKFGFAIGNTAQAILFGLLHGIMLFGALGIGKALIVILFTGSVGWVLGYINEKEAGGSIFLSWLLHGLANTLAALASMFNIGL